MGSLWKGAAGRTCTIGAWTAMDTDTPSDDRELYDWAVIWVMTEAAREGERGGSFTQAAGLGRVGAANRAAPLAEMRRAAWAGLAPAWHAVYIS